MLLLYLVSLVSATPTLKLENGQCEPVRINFCKGMPYNSTIFPNLLGHQNHIEASLHLTQYHALARVNCSENIKFFLCALYSPMCSILGKPMLPCRDVCVKAKTDCGHLIKFFEKDWPEEFNCDRLPTEGACIRRDFISPKTNYQCPNSMKSPNPLHYLPMRSGTLKNCGLQCEEEIEDRNPIFFNQDQRDNLLSWIGYCSIASFICCAITLVTFITDLGRFQYPVRPILYMTACYLAVSLVYVIGAYAPMALSCGLDDLVIQGSGDLPCAILGSVQYFFSLASNIWWVIFCFGWFLTIKLQWGVEAVTSLHVFFHLAAWGLPLMGTVLAGINEAMDGDILTGTCSVGNLNPLNLLIFTIIPSSICVLVGFFFLMWGLTYMYRLRDEIYLNHPETQVGGLSKLLRRIFIFSVLYAIPTIIGLMALVIQAKELPDWIESWYAKQCISSAKELFTHESYCPKDFNIQPTMGFFLLKYFSQLMVGIACSFWIASAKTVMNYWDACMCGMNTETISNESYES